MFNIKNGYFFSKKFKDKKALFKKDKDKDKNKKNNNTMIHKRTTSNFISNTKNKKQKSNKNNQTKIKPSPKSVFMQKINNIITPSKVLQSINKQKVNLKDRNLSLYIDKKFKNKLIKKSKNNNYNNSLFELKNKNLTKNENLNNINKIVENFYNKLVWLISDVEKGFEDYTKLKAKINRYFEENSKNLNIQEKNLLKKISDYFIELLDCNSKNKNVVQSNQNNKSIQTDKIEEKKELLLSIKNYAKNLLLKGSKGEYKLENLIKYLSNKRQLFLLEKIDYEKQKLLKVLIDLFQKEFIYQEIINILEDEDINLNDLYLMAFERIKADKKDSQKSECTESNLKIDLEEIKKKENNVGFHQEFMDNFNEFSESWKKIAKIEENKGRKINKKMQLSN